MILNDIVAIVKDKMCEAVVEYANTPVPLPISVFFTNTPEDMRRWMAKRKIQTTINNYNSVILRMDARGAERNPEPLNTTVVPFIIRNVHAQNVVWAGTTWHMDLGDDLTDRIMEDIKKGVTVFEATNYLELQEAFLIMACDREVAQSWTCNICRDNDGELVRITEWEELPDFADDNQFLTYAQKALRSL